MNRITDKILARPPAFWMIAAGVLWALGFQPAAHAAPFQDHKSIQKIASDFIAQRHPWQGMKVAIEAGRLDPRTQLARCRGNLQAFLPPGGQVKQRTTVGVRCVSDSRKWKIYLPVSVKAYANVLVARHPLAPGTVLTEADVQRSRRDIATLSYGYVPSLGQQGGYRTRLSVAQGAVITPNMLESAVSIRRGQTVTLVSHSGPVSVSMSGEALGEATLGQRIRIRNGNSGRVVEGIVRSEETVEIQ